MKYVYQFSEGTIPWIVKTWKRHGIRCKIRQEEMQAFFGAASRFTAS